jgi:hypothetical protein
MRAGWAVLLALIVGDAGCLASLGGFNCGSDAACGVGRVCIGQRCAAADPGCPGGYRWDGTAGARSGQCAFAPTADLAAPPGSDLSPGGACTTGARCSVGPTAGTCLSGTCCTGCVSGGTACLTAPSVTDCGIGGVACVSCDDHNDCTADACQADGTCTHTPVANGLTCNGALCQAGAACPGACASCVQIGSCQAAQCVGGSTYSCCHVGSQCRASAGRASCSD